MGGGGGSGDDGRSRFLFFSFIFIILILNKLLETRREEMDRYEGRANSFLGLGKHLNISKCDAFLFVFGLVCENAKEMTIQPDRLEVEYIKTFFILYKIENFVLSPFLLFCFATIRRN